MHCSLQLQVFSEIFLLCDCMETVIECLLKSLVCSNRFINPGDNSMLEIVTVIRPPLH